MSTGHGLSSLIPPKRNEPPTLNGGSTNSGENAGVQVSHPNISFHDRGLERGQAPRSSPQSSVQHEHRPLAQAKPPKSGEMIYQLETDKILPNPYQPRAEFPDEGLRELAQSIREFGILQPLVVSKIIKETEAGADVEYQLITGERRLRAARIAGLERVPAIIRAVDGARHKLEMALIENVQRADLNPLESAKAYARLQDEFGLTQREIAARVGKSREAVANTLRLLNLPAAARQALAEGRLNESQARTLLGIQSPEEQNRVLANILTGKMSVRAVRGEVEKAKPQDPEAGYWSKRIEENLGAPVRVLKEGGRGKIVVEFFSDDEWRALTEKLGGPAE